MIAPEYIPTEQFCLIDTTELYTVIRVSTWEAIASGGFLCAMAMLAKREKASLYDCAGELVKSFEGEEIPQ